MSLSHRQAAVAGQFYPDKVAVLQSDITHYITTVVELPELNSIAPKAIIVPHAGYMYSGVIAASAYNLLQKHAATITKAIILGPAHRVSFSGIAISSANYFDTPLGSVEINQSSIDNLTKNDFIHENDAAHEHEHSIEVQLPFLQTILHNFTIVPLLIGQCDENDVASILELLWGGDETLIVISSDLSHFETYEIANKMDTKTSQAILNLQPEKIQFEDACGRTAINGLLKIAQKKNLTPYIIDVRNSGDTAGDKKRVVGYGAYSLS